MKRKKIKRATAQRLQTVIDGDRLRLPEGYLSFIGYDIEKLLGDYFELSGSPQISVNGREGKYTVTVTAEAVRTKPFGILQKT